VLFLPGRGTLCHPGARVTLSQRDLPLAPGRVDLRGRRQGHQAEQEQPQPPPAGRSGAGGRMPCPCHGPPGAAWAPASPAGLAGMPASPAVPIPGDGRNVIESLQRKGCTAAGAVLTRRRREWPLRHARPARRRLRGFATNGVVGGTSCALGRRFVAPRAPFVASGTAVVPSRHAPAPSSTRWATSLGRNAKEST